MLNQFLGNRAAFSFPKSLYAVADAVRLVVEQRPQAVVLDFFAGSGTTFHAVAVLNAQDGGNRQCIMVTNNDVSEAEATFVNASHFPGDPKYDALGIFESVTKPRVEAAITGIRPDGQPVQGKYLEQYLPDHAYTDGFEENVAFFRMDYLEPDVVELGRQFNAIAPLLWLAAGSVGAWEEGRVNGLAERHHRLRLRAVPAGGERALEEDNSDGRWRFATGRGNGSFSRRPRAPSSHRSSGRRRLVAEAQEACH